MTAPDCTVCGGETSGRKPFCVDHLARLPYVQDLLDQIAEMEGEIERVRQEGKDGADPRGLFAYELMIKLTSDKMGSSTVKKIAREMRMRWSIVGAFFLALEGLERVSLSRTPRGSIVVQLVEPCVK